MQVQSPDDRMVDDSSEVEVKVGVQLVKVLMIDLEKVFDCLNSFLDVVQVEELFLEKH